MIQGFRYISKEKVAAGCIPVGGFIYRRLCMNVIVFLADGFEEIEALTPVDYLRRSGISVQTVSCSSNCTVTGSHGIPVIADCTVSSRLEESSVPDAVVIPGGMPGASNIADCDGARQLIMKAAGAGKVVAAICAAPVVVLGPLGLLQHKKYTCYPGMEQQLSRWCGAEPGTDTSGAVHTGNRCEIDGCLITAAGPGAAEEFALALVGQLAGSDAVADLIQHSVLRRP